MGIVSLAPWVRLRRQYGYMERTMFTRDDVKSSLKPYVLVELYTDRTGKFKINDEKNQQLELKLTNTATLPVYVVVSPTGAPVRNFPGSTSDPDQFVSFIRKH